MLFADVIGQQNTKRHLLEMVEQNRLSHALIFLGKEGCGALSLALAFAQYISLLPASAKQDAEPSLFGEPVEAIKPGDKPVSTDYIQDWREFIQQFAYGNVYDWLQFIGAENKQGNITAEECNDIIRTLNLKSFESPYKILVMWMPEYLGKEGNKLLKLIEEPPADTLFILVAENESSILSTILSRCQLVKVPAIDDAAVAEALISRAGASAEKAR